MTCGNVLRYGLDRGNVLRMKTTKNVRLARSNRVHVVIPATESGIFNRALVPACRTGAGQSGIRIATTDQVTCPRCLKVA